MQTKRLTELALLATIALTIFMVESKIPNPTSRRETGTGKYRNSLRGVPLPAQRGDPAPDHSDHPGRGFRWKHDGPVIQRGRRGALPVGDAPAPPPDPGKSALDQQYFGGGIPQYRADDSGNSCDEKSWSCYVFPISVGFRVVCGVLYRTVRTVSAPAQAPHDEPCADAGRTMIPQPLNSRKRGVLQCYSPIVI